MGVTIVRDKVFGYIGLTEAKAGPVTLLVWDLPGIGIFPLFFCM